jgi:ABC-type bacteriocin/lantibiotic exporter with double-glycine peptidase domain
MADPYEVDDEGRPVAEASAGDTAPVVEATPEEEAAVRRQVEQTLRAMMLSTIIGAVVIVIVAVVVPDIRGVMILVGIVYVVSSLAAQWYLRRKFMSRLKAPGAG